MKRFILAILVFFACCCCARVIKAPARLLITSSGSGNTGGLFEKALSTALGGVKITAKSTAALLSQYQGIQDWLNVRPENVMDVMSELQANPEMSQAQRDDVELAGSVASAALTMADESNDSRFSSR